MTRIKMYDLMQYSKIAIPVLNKVLDAFIAKYPENSELRIPFRVPDIDDIFYVNVSTRGITLQQKYRDTEYYGIKLDSGQGSKSSYDFFVPNNIESWETNISKKDENDVPISGELSNKVFYYYETDKFPEELYYNSEMSEDVDAFMFQLSLVQDIINVQELRAEINLAKELSDMLPPFSMIFCEGGYFTKEVFEHFVDVVKGLDI